MLSIWSSEQTNETMLSMTEKWGGGRGGGGGGGGGDEGEGVEGVEGGI